MEENTSKDKGAKRDDTTFVNLMTDAGMKAVLADPDNKELLIELLNILLPKYVQVKDIKQYRDREKTPDFAGAKKTVLDLSCEGEDGSMFNVEVQQEIDDFFFERVIYYAAGDYHSQLKKGDDYENLKPVYEIVITPRTLWHESIAESQERPIAYPTGNRKTVLRGKDLLPEKIVTRYMMKEEDADMFAPSSIFCIFAELGRFKKTLAECRTKEDFTFFWFLNGWKEDRIPEILAQIPFCEKIAKACEVAAFSEEKYKIYQANMRNERDIEYFAKVKYQRGREEGVAKGREEGLAKGREEEKLSLAKNFKSLGVSIVQRAQATGLSEEEVAAL